MDDFDRELNEFIQTIREKNLERLDKNKLTKFTANISEFLNIRNKFANELTQLRISTEEKIHKFEYSKGGEVIHRGIHCPSLVYDLIVGNVKRGRLLKRKPEFGKYSYEFGFDNENKLIRVRQVNEFTTLDSHNDEEYMIYEKNTVIGVIFDHTGQLNAVSKCTYDNGKILKYEMCFWSTEESAELYVEEYFYKNNHLSEVNVLDISPQIALYEEQKYEVELNEQGKYQVGVKNAWFTEERTKSYIFPKEFLGLSGVGLLLKKDKEHIKDLADFARADLSLAPIAASNAQYTIVDEYNQENPDNKANLVAGDEFSVDVVQWVNEGRVDGGIYLGATYENQILAEEGPYHNLVNDVIYNEFTVVKTWPLFNKQEQEFADAYDEAIKKIKEEEKTNEIMVQFYNNDLFRFLDTVNR